MAWLNFIAEIIVFMPVETTFFYFSVLALSDREPSPNPLLSILT